jgi:hypothetical protein
MQNRKFEPYLSMQVYRARLASSGLEVAVKVQRPEALSIISKASHPASRADCVPHAARPTGLESRVTGFLTVSGNIRTPASSCMNFQASTKPFKVFFVFRPILVIDHALWSHCHVAARLMAPHRFPCAVEDLCRIQGSSLRCGLHGPIIT